MVRYRDWSPGYPPHKTLRDHLTFRTGRMRLRYRTEEKKEEERSVPGISGRSPYPVQWKSRAFATRKQINKGEKIPTDK